METKETLLKTTTETTLAYNEDYFRHIFKKTEKINCAVFLVTRSGRDIDIKDTIVRDLEDTAQRLMGVSFLALRATSVIRQERLEDLNYTLIELETKLRTAHSAHLIPTEHLMVFLNEIDVVQRSLKKYMTEENAGPLSGFTKVSRDTKERKSLLSESSIKREGGVNAGGQTVLSRRDRIMDFLKDRTDATIKDITEVITDCSEKTVQRELTSLIKDGLIAREGERRWSKYNLV